MKTQPLENPLPLFRWIMPFRDLLTIFYLCVNLGTCRPIQWSTTVRTEGNWVVRHDELFMMNCPGPKGTSNTLGKVVYVKIVQMAWVNPDGTIEVRKQVVIEETELPSLETLEGEPSIILPGEGARLPSLETLEGEPSIVLSGEVVQETNPPIVPETPEEKSWLGSVWESASPWVHGTLDVVGLIPLAGDLIADGANAAIYAAEGNWIDAGLSAGAMIPFAGWGATGGKWVRKAVKHGDEIVDGVQRGVNFFKKSGDKIVDGIKKGAQWVKNSKLGQAVANGANQLKNKASKWASDAAKGLKKKWDDFWKKKKSGGDAPEPEKPKKSGGKDGDDGTKVTQKKFNRPAKRHSPCSVNQKTVAKDKNTVIDPELDISDDLAKINAGKAQKVGDKLVVNQRTYGYHDNGTLYPISGPGFHELDRATFKALGVFNKFGNTERAMDILKNMKIVDSQLIKKALEISKKCKK